MRNGEIEELGVGHRLRVQSERFDLPGLRHVCVACVQGLYAQEGRIAPRRQRDHSVRLEFDREAGGGRSDERQQTGCDEAPAAHGYFAWIR